VEFKKLRKEENFDVKKFKRLAERVRDRVIKGSVAIVRG
jgi:hypothetical protein